MLDKIVLPTSICPDIGDKLPYGVELVVPREDDAFLLPLFLSALRISLSLLLYFKMKELVDDVEQTVLLQCNLPQMRDGISFRVGRVAGATVIACPSRTLVERKEPSPLALQLRSHICILKINREESDHSAIELKASLTRIAVVAPLENSVVDVLASELVLEFDSDYRDAIHIQNYIDRLISAPGKMELANATACVHYIAFLGALVKARLWHEVNNLERDSPMLESMLEHRYDSFGLDMILKHLCKLERGIGVAHAFESLPAHPNESCEGSPPFGHMLPF